MRVLVTGGAGFIGAATTQALLERGDDVTVLDALTQPVHEAGSPARVPEGARFVHGDVTDPEALAGALQGAEAVVHLAAYQDYGTDFSRFITVNAAGTALLYEVMDERVRRVVVASSESVYGEGQIHCPEHGVVGAAQRTPRHLAAGDWAPRCERCGAAGEPVAMTEDFARPHNAYGISKLAAEQAALVLGARDEIPTVALRYAIVHGPGQSPRNAYSGLLRAACLAWLAGRAPVVFEDGEQLRDYVSIDDAVAATLLALDHPEAPGHAYNVGGARSMTVNEVLAALAPIVGGGAEPVREGIWRVGDVRHTIGDTSALRALGWSPSDDLPQVWARYWTWLLDQGVTGETAQDALTAMRASGILRTTDI